MTNTCDPDDGNDNLLDGVETNTGVFVDANDTGTDPLKMDTDADACKDGKEAGGNHNLGGQRDPKDGFDFADVPNPALLLVDATGAQNKIVDLSDVLADLQYAGTT